jgi:hypothetical protein
VGGASRANLTVYSMRTVVGGIIIKTVRCGVLEERPVASAVPLTIRGSLGGIGAQDHSLSL